MELDDEGSTRDESPSSMRPVVHFTPQGGWLNDPNGLVYADGVYHLFYQHNPYDVCWGPMHWGHATSTNLIEWTHHPIALAPDPLGMIFSGSAVTDEHDTAGFGAGAIVAAFTYRLGDRETQALASSTNGGSTFAKFDGNPVLVGPDGEQDFRDPKVIRFGGARGHWVMLLAVRSQVWIYTSHDLRTWVPTDTVGSACADLGVWETPELFELVADDGTAHWVLTIGTSHGAPAGGSGVRALLGRFDGRRFTHDGDEFWVDHGSDFYAPQSWNGAPDDRRIWIGWMSNWLFAADAVETSWRGQMSVPRELSLQSAGTTYRLKQTPVPELAGTWSEAYIESLVALDPERAHEPDLNGEALDVIVEGIDIGASIEIACRRGDAVVIVRVDRPASRLTVSAHGSGGPDLGGSSGRATSADITGAADEERLRIILDTASVEVFSGTTTISNLLVNSDEPWWIAIRTDHDATSLGRLEIHRLRNIHRGGTADEEGAFSA